MSPIGPALGPLCAFCFHPVGGEGGAPGRSLRRNIDGCFTVHNDTRDCEALIETYGGRGLRCVCCGVEAVTIPHHTNYQGQVFCWQCADGECACNKKATALMKPTPKPEGEGQECAAPDEPRTTVYGVDIHEWDNRWREMERRLGDISGGMLRLLLAIEASRE